MSDVSDLKTMLAQMGDMIQKLVDDKRTKWNDNHDNLLQTWRKQASINLWLQLASNYYYARLNDYLSYPAIIVSAATSIGVFGTDDSLKGKFTISILALVSGILTAVNKHCRAAERSQEYALRAKDYYTFIRELDFILASSKEERDDLGSTLERVRNTYDRIVDMQMEPPIHIVRQYEKKFRPLEASLFTDLQSEIRSISGSDVQSKKEIPRDTLHTNAIPLGADRRSIDRRQTAILTPAGALKTPPNIFSTEHSPFEKNGQSKVIHKRLKNMIFSPYQLYSSQYPNKAEELSTHNNIIFPQGSVELRPSIDGRPPIIRLPPIVSSDVIITMNPLSTKKDESNMFNRHSTETSTEKQPSQKHFQDFEEIQEDNRKSPQ